MYSPTEWLASGKHSARYTACTAGGGSSEVGERGPFFLNYHHFVYVSDCVRYLKPWIHDFWKNNTFFKVMFSTILKHLLSYRKLCMYIFFYYGQIWTVKLLYKLEDVQQSSKYSYIIHFITLHFIAFYYKKKLHLTVKISLIIFIMRYI